MKIVFVILIFAHLAHAAPREGEVRACENIVGGNVKLLRAFGGPMLIRPPGARRDISTVTYSLDFTLASFCLKPEHLRYFKGKKVALVGEGFGAFLPATLAAEADVVAIDPLYAFKDLANLDRAEMNPPQLVTIQSMADYITQYGPWLKVGTAQALPLETASQDFCISHFVYNNFLYNEDELDWDLLRAAFTESLRVVKPGGKVVDALHLNHITDLKLKRLLNQLAADGLLKSYVIQNLAPRMSELRAENGFTGGQEFTSSCLTITR